MLKEVTLKISSSSTQREFLSKEIEVVLNSYNNLIEETRRLERYSILVTGVTWAWCASNATNYAFNLLIWFPAVACNLFGLRAAAIHWQSRAARAYLALVEREFGLQGDLGWASAQIRHSKGFAAFAAATAYVFWTVVGIGTLVVPYMYLRHMH